MEVGSSIRQVYLGTQQGNLRSPLRVGVFEAASIKAIYARSMFQQNFNKQDFVTFQAFRIFRANKRGRFKKNHELVPHFKRRFNYPFASFKFYA